MVSYVMQIVSIPNNRVPRGTPFDGQYVVEYDAHRLAENIIGAHLVTTRDLATAKRFTSQFEATEYALVSRGRRPWDGRPDRPLTAFTIRVDDERAFAAEETGPVVDLRGPPIIRRFAEDVREE